MPMIFGFIAAWWPLRHEPNVLLLHYADLKREPEASVRRIAEFLGFDVPDAQWPAILEYTSFPWMKAHEEQVRDLQRRRRPDPRPRRDDPQGSGRSERRGRHHTGDLRGHRRDRPDDPHRPEGVRLVLPRRCARSDHHAVMTRTTVVCVRQPPSGTVTFLFTDIEGSTRLWEERPDEMRGRVAEHDAIVPGGDRGATAGSVVNGTGDGFDAAFGRAADAVAAAEQLQAASGRSSDAPGADGDQHRRGAGARRRLLRPAGEPHRRG